MWSYAFGLLAPLEEAQMQQYLAKKKNNTACKHGEYISEHIINIYAHI